MELVIVTGLSGAGKSTAADALEDMGFFCADNILPGIIPDFVACLKRASEKRERVAIVTDIRAGELLENIFDDLDALSKMNVRYKILFLEASDEVLLGRYKLTRRRHPLADRYFGMVHEALSKEREMLARVRLSADYIIDTTGISAGVCKERIRGIFMDKPKKFISVHCVSFGFKHGLPTDADLVFDVRCLPNPYYIDELKNRTGLDKEVSDYVMKHEQAACLLEQIETLVDYSMPLYADEGRSQLVIAVGCTGGHHRSVVFACEIFRHLSKEGYNVTINHRDILI